ncbi:MAG: hypothetical protein PF636_04985 [Actinomycetota bacterium]|nr:hypothetical protein [Actinomycetota bacterium]
MIDQSVSLLVVFVLGLLPGALGGAWIARRLDLGVVGWLVSAFAVCSGLAGVVYLFAVWMGLTLGAGIWMWLGLAFFVSAACAGELRHVRELWSPGDGPGLAVVVLSGIGAFISGPWMEINVDTFYHLAAARSLLHDGVLIVTNPLYGSMSTDPDPTSGLLHAMWAMWAQVKGADPLFLVVGITVLGAVVNVGGFWLLARSVSAKSATLVTGFYVVLKLFLDFRSMVYPSHIAFGLMLLGVVAVIEVMRTSRAPAWLLLAACSVAVGGMHVGAAQIMLISVSVAAMVVALFPADGRRLWKRMVRGGMAAGMCGGMIAATVVPRVAFLTQVTTMVSPSSGGSATAVSAVPGTVSLGWLGSILDPAMFYEPGTVGFVLLAVLAVLALVVSIRRGDAAAAAISAATLIPVVITVVPPISGLALDVSFYVTRRVASSMSPLMFLPLGVSLGLGARGRIESAFQSLSVVAIVVSILLAAPFVRTVVWPTPSTQVERIGTANESIWLARERGVFESMDLIALGAIREEIGDSWPVIGATTETGYVLAGMLPAHTVASWAGHSPVAVEVSEGPMRREAMETFFSPFSTETVRRKIAEDWDIDYVALWMAQQSNVEAAACIDAQEGLFEPIVEYRSMRLYRILSEE